MGWMKRDNTTSNSPENTKPDKPKMVRNESADGQVCWTAGVYEGGDKPKAEESK
jgi:hypothetical protein